MTLSLTPLQGIPLVQPGDDLARHITEAISFSNVDLRDGDILVVTQKIVSKAERRFRNLSQVVPTQEAVAIAEKVEKDARFVQLVLEESNAILRMRPGTMIVEHRLGFVCANAGIDHSNVQNLGGNPEDWVLLLPENPDASADHIRRQLKEKFGKQIAVLIIDSHGRAWRNGVVGVAVGLAGMPGLVDLRGRADLFGYQLRVTQVAVADELAAAASLLMGQSDEFFPVIHVRGFPYALRDGAMAELIRPKELDLFR